MIVENHHFRSIPDAESRMLDLDLGFKTEISKPISAIYRVALKSVTYAQVIFYISVSRRHPGFYNVRMVINYQYENEEFQRKTYYSTDLDSTATAIQVCGDSLILVRRKLQHHQEFEELPYPWRIEYAT